MECWNSYDEEIAWWKFSKLEESLSYNRTLSMHSISYSWKMSMLYLLYIVTDFQNHIIYFMLNDLDVRATIKWDIFQFRFPFLFILLYLFFTVSSQIFVSLCLRFRYNRKYVYISYFRTHTLKFLHFVCSSAMLKDLLIPSLYLSFTFLLIRVRKLSLCRLSVLVMVLD